MNRYLFGILVALAFLLWFFWPGAGPELQASVGPELGRSTSHDATSRDLREATRNSGLLSARNSGRKRTTLTGPPQAQPSVFSLSGATLFHQRGSKYCFLRKSEVRRIVTFLLDPKVDATTTVEAEEVVEGGVAIGPVTSWAIPSRVFHRAFGRCYDGRIPDDQFFTFDRIDGVPVEMLGAFEEGYRTLLEPGLHELGMANKVEGFSNSDMGIFLQVIQD